MATIQFSQKTKNDCLKPLAPVVGQDFNTITVGTGDAPHTAVTAATGTEPFTNVLISNQGCAPLQATITYLDSADSDCDDCTPRTLSTVDIVIDIPPFVDCFELPAGLISNIDYVTTDVFAGAATPVVKEQSVLVYATGKTQCSECAILVP